MNKKNNNSYGSGSIGLCNCFLSLQQEACSSSWQPAARSLMTEEEASLQLVVHFPESVQAPSEQNQCKKTARVVVFQVFLLQFRKL